MFAQDNPLNGAPLYQIRRALTNAGRSPVLIRKPFGSRVRSLRAPHRGPRRTGGLGAAEIAVNPAQAPPAWLTNVSNLLQTGASIYQSERIAKENLKRAREGLPPLSAAQMRSLGAQANVNIELPPELKYGLLAGGAALLLILARKGRRR